MLDPTAAVTFDLVLASASNASLLSFQFYSRVDLRIKALVESAIRSTILSTMVQPGGAATREASILLAASQMEADLDLDNMPIGFDSSLGATPPTLLLADLASVKQLTANLTAVPDSGSLEDLLGSCDIAHTGSELPQVAATSSAARRAGARGAADPGTRVVHAYIQSQAENQLTQTDTSEAREEILEKWGELHFMDPARPDEMRGQVTGVQWFPAGDCNMLIATMYDGTGLGRMLVRINEIQFWVRYSTYVQDNIEILAPRDVDYMSDTEEYTRPSAELFGMWEYTEPNEETDEAGVGVLAPEERRVARRAPTERAAPVRASAELAAAPAEDTGTLQGVSLPSGTPPPRRSESPTGTRADLGGSSTSADVPTDSGGVAEFTGEGGGDDMDVAASKRARGSGESLRTSTERGPSQKRTRGRGGRLK